MVHRVDLHARAAAQGVDLGSALASLRELYADVDERNERNTKDLQLPCHSGCSACCEESVFVTPLEFYGVWDHVQTHCDDATLARIVDDGLALYRRHESVLLALEQPPPEGHSDHTALVRDVAFRCPMLDGGGRCLAYPMREMLGRLFGCSFNDSGGVYGCHLVGAHLGGKTLTLVRARPNANRVLELPLTHKQQLYPFYIHELYGPQSAP